MMVEGCGADGGVGQRACVRGVTAEVTLQFIAQPFHVRSCYSIACNRGSTSPVTSSDQ